MLLNEYQTKATRTAIYPINFKLIYPALKMNGEAGEVAEKVGKWIRDQGCAWDKLDKQALALEIGDVLWYVANIANDLGYTLQEIAELNVEKLQRRLAANTVKGSGDNR